MGLLGGRMDFTAYKALSGWETGSPQPLTVSINTLVGAHTDAARTRETASGGVRGSGCALGVRSGAWGHPTAYRLGVGSPLCLLAAMLASQTGCKD